MTGKLKTYMTCVDETQNTLNLKNSVKCKGKYSLKELSAKKLKAFSVVKKMLTLSRCTAWHDDFIGNSY